MTYRIWKDAEIRPQPRPGNHIPQAPLDHHSTSADIARHTAEAQRQDAMEAGKARRLPPLSPADLDADYRAYKGPWANPPRRKREPSGWWIPFVLAIVLTAAVGLALISG